MKGVWVKRLWRANLQTTAKRHFFEDDGWHKTPVTTTVVTTGGMGRQYPWYDYIHEMTGKSLCGRKQRYGGKDVTYNYASMGSTTNTIGGLCIKKKVRLNQRNLCWHCLVKYMKDQPQDVRKAFALLNKSR